MFIQQEGEHESVSCEGSPQEPPFRNPPKQIESTKGSVALRQKILRCQSEIEPSVSVSLSSNKVNSHSYIRRLEQNRRSAKKSRNKKKEHLQLLERRAQQLELQLETTKTDLKTAKDNVDKYLSQRSVANNFNIHRKLTYQRLEALVAEDNPDEDEINLLLDTLRQKVGATGSEREGTVNYYFKQIMNVCFPALHRYMMWTAERSTEFFGQKDPDSSWLESMRSEISKLTPEQREKIKLRQCSFATLKLQLQSLISELHHTKQQIDLGSEALQKMIEEARKEVLSPVQSAQFLLFVENSKYKKEMHDWSKNNIRKFSEEIKDSEPKPTKRMRLT